MAAEGVVVWYNPTRPVELLDCLRSRRYPGPFDRVQPGGARSSVGVGTPELAAREGLRRSLARWGAQARAASSGRPDSSGAAPAARPTSRQSRPADQAPAAASAPAICSGNRSRPSLRAASTVEAADTPARARHAQPAPASAAPDTTSTAPAIAHGQRRSRTATTSASYLTWRAADVTILPIMSEHRIDLEQVRHVARLARLELSDEELAAMALRLDDLVGRIAFLLGVLADELNGRQQHRRVEVSGEPAVDGALRVDAVEADPDRLELAALRGAADRLRMNAEPLGEPGSSPDVAERSTRSLRRSCSSRVATPWGTATAWSRWTPGPGPCARAIPPAA